MSSLPKHPLKSLWRVQPPGASQPGLLPREVKRGWLGRDVCGQPNLQTTVPAMERKNSISESQLKPEELALFIHWSAVGAFFLNLLSFWYLVEEFHICWFFLPLWYPNCCSKSPRAPHGLVIRSGHLILIIPWTLWPLLLVLILPIVYTASSWNQYNYVHQQPPIPLGTTETARPCGYFYLLSKSAISFCISHQSMPLHILMLLKC